MTAAPIRNQNGYVLLLTVLMLMGVGGVVLAGFTQQARQELEVQRYQHNQRVLQEAKQALLMFAYNYPQTNANGIGPGRLPCPDVDNDGTVDGPGTCAQVGRFPWADDRLGIQETLDASGEGLWYAVSDAFDNIAGGGVINYDTTGTITLVDQSGGIIYDGAIAGIAAVIIAPGAILKRDENADGSYEFTQLRNTDPQKIDPRNYLDTFNGFDNSVFTNGESDTNDDGFIMGPVYDSAQSTIVVNDQLIIITADEVIAMAEKAVLAAYRDAIEDYLAPTVEGGTDGVYPWLYNYADVADLDDLSGYYPANASFATEKLDNLGSAGRIPSIFAEYFTRTTSQPIESELKVTMMIDYSAITPVPSSISHGDLPFIDGEHTLEFTIPVILTDLRFTDDATDPNGRLTATLASAQTFNQFLYFWDEDEALRTGFWRVCPDNGDILSDCHRDLGQNPTPGGSNDSNEEILRIDLQISLPAGTITFDADYSTLPTSAVTAADGSAHATISGTVVGSALDLAPVTSPTITATFEYDPHYHVGEAFTVDESGPLTVTDLLVGATLTLEMRFYPELPGWAFDNGWHNSVMMAYADDYRPDTLTGPCTVVGLDCLDIANTGGIRNDKVSLLVIAGQHDWVDDDTDGMADEVGDVFDLENEDLDPSFDARAVDGNDHLLVIEEI